MDATPTTPVDEKPGREPVPGQLLFGVEQAARVLGCSPKLVRIFIARGELRTRRLGVRVLIHRQELERFARRDHGGVQP
jgi:excisionase family DNA binding protein